MENPVKVLLKFSSTLNRIYFRIYIIFIVILFSLFFDKNVLLVLTEITVRKTALHSSMVDSAEKSVRVVHVIKSSDA